MVDYNKVIETAAGGNLGLLVTKLASLTLNKFYELKAISGNIDLLKEEVEILHAVLLDLSNEEDPSQQQKLWKNRVMELSYDMEDAIDEFDLASKSPAIQEAGASNFIERAVQSVQSCIERIKNLPSDYVINQKIQSLRSRIDLSEERHKRLKTGRQSEGTSNDAIAIRDLAQYADPAGLVGIDAPREDIFRMLTQGNRSSTQRRVVAIVGFGGLGKTTLAQQVYDKIAAEGFTCKTFVTVSRNPDIHKILIDIMVGFKSSDKPEDLRQLDRRQLTEKLREYIQEKRYLVVIDDVWSVDAWKFIEAALYDNSRGSRIIVTTRKNDVAEECRRSRNGYVYRLDPLGDVEAEQLFIARAFPHNKGCPPNLDEVCRKVLKKCGGSPLAILTLSASLANKETADEWEQVLDSLSYEVVDEDSDVNLMRRILSFSYYDLPQHLRTCLLYMSIFPEDAVIKRKRLVNRWIAQGFISTEARSKTKAGEHYFNELISRCLIQPLNISYDGRARACKVHDTILDFIKHKSKEESFVAFVGAQEGTLKSKVRHLSVQVFEICTGLGLGEHEVCPARSLTVSGRTEEMVFNHDFSRFPSLRVLDLENLMYLRDTVIDVSRLFQLKYLATGRLHAKSIQGIVNLQYLETLDLRKCILDEFPHDIYKLKHLVRLFIHSHIYIHGKLPGGIREMKALEELKYINADRSSLDFLQELGCLAKLRSVSVCLEPDSRDKEKELVLISSLHKLGMDGRNNLESITVVNEYETMAVNLDDSNNDPSWRDALLNIRKFNMKGVRFTEVPGWMGSLNHIEKIELSVEYMGQKDLDILAELRRLLYLYLYFEFYPAEGLTFRGTTTFQCLKYLRIPCYTAWTKLTIGSLPRLQHLQIDLYLYENRPEIDSDDEEFPPSGFFFDIGHLHSLTQVHVKIHHWFKDDKNEEAAAKIIRDAVNAHPKKPKLEIY